MPRKPLESEYLYGLHDPGGEHMMRDADRKGWILFTEEIGHNKDHHGGTDYRRWSNDGFGVIVRLNNGYHPRGTIPYSDEYENFARRCANFVAGSAGAHMWIIGNEMNFAIERPADRNRSLSFSAPSEDEHPSSRARSLRDQYTLAPGRASVAFRSPDEGETITPEMYARCYTLCRNAIHAVPGHEEDLVLTGSVAPWNPNTGDWIQYLSKMLARLGPEGCDGITLHTYTHGHDLRLIHEDQFMDPPFDRYRFNLRCFIDFMEAIPANMRHLPVYITEADQDAPWLDDGSVPWIEHAYGEIDRWNKAPGNQQIRAMILYRWPKFDKWWIQGKGNVIADFKRAMEKGFKWGSDVELMAAALPKFAQGQQVFVAMTLNMRRTPGWRNKPADDILGQLAVRTPAVVQGGPAYQDSLTWWPVASTLSDGTPATGWAADALTDGKILLSAEMPPLPPETKTGTFAPGETVTNVSSDPVNVRSTPGHKNKPSTDVVAGVQPGTELTIVQGPQEVDGLFWWQVSGTGVNGWVAEAAPSGVRLLAPKSLSAEIRVGSPFRGQAPMTQGWGSNPTFYNQFKYDGVPLRGHNGLDFGTAMNTPLIAVDEGSVKRTGFDPGGFGNFILLRHEWGESLYAHLEVVQVQQGQPVDTGAVIGLSGNTGASTGPHLHFSIRINPYRRTDGWGGFANPVPFMDLARAISFAPIEGRDPSPIGEETLENPLP